MLKRSICKSQRIAHQHSEEVSHVVIRQVVSRVDLSLVRCVTELRVQTELEDFDVERYLGDTMAGNYMNISPGVNAYMIWDVDVMVWKHSSGR